MIGHKTFAIVIFVAIAVVGVAEAGFGNCPSSSTPVYGLWDTIAIANEVRSEGGVGHYSLASFHETTTSSGRSRTFCRLPTIIKNTNETIVLILTKKKRPVHFHARRR